MGGNFTKELNIAFDHGQGGDVSGGAPMDWNQGLGGDGRGNPENPDIPYPVKGPPPPTVPKYVQPQAYSPKQSQLQKTTYNPSSTSHGYLSRFSVGKHF